MGKTKILIVDDYPLSRTVLRYNLMGMCDLEKKDILEASNGKEALEILRRDKGVDIVISDYEMPEMNGIELLKKTRSCEDFPNVCFIGMSALDRRHEFIRDGANGFFRKPVDPSVLARIINRLKFKLRS